MMCTIVGGAPSSLAYAACLEHMDEAVVESEVLWQHAESSGLFETGQQLTKPRAQQVDTAIEN